jgi:ABC-type branched-subunit amino acid transport system substrate-binding protein
MGTPTNKATYRYVTEIKKVPLVYPATGAHIWGYPYKKYIFPGFNDYWQEAWIVIDYFIHTRGIKQVGGFYQDGDYGRDVAEPGIKRIKQHGLKVFGEEKYKSDQVDVSGQVAKLKQAGAQAVLLGTVYIAGSQFLRESSKIGWNVLAGGISPTGTQKMIDLSGSGAPGFVNTMPFPELEHSTTPASVKYRKILHKYYSTAPFDDTTMWGWPAGMAFSHVLDLTGRDLTRENMIHAYETKFKNWTSGIIPPVTVSETSHAAPLSRYMAVVRKLPNGSSRFIPIALDMEKEKDATPQWLVSWGRTLEQTKADFQAVAKFPQK